MRKQSKLAIITLAVILLLGITVFAATDTFNTTLPAKQNDTEVSTVGRANSTDVYKYFTIKITSLGSGYTSVRAWTEDRWGGNYSDPYNEASLNVSKNINYSFIPSKGSNVTLNLDNPSVHNINGLCCWKLDSKLINFTKAFKLFTRSITNCTV